MPPSVESCPQPSNTLPVLGIDLGTTMSAVAVVDGSQRIRTLRDQHDRRLTPSALYFGDEAYVGVDAVQMEQETPGSFVEVFKRDMGEPHYHEKIRDYWVPPEVFASFVIRKLADDAIRQVGPIGKVVITVPAYYDERRRQATLAAARMAGVDVADIINEPTAAALAHYCSSAVEASRDRVPARPLAPRGPFAEKSRIMVYDLGGGTFDVSILEADDKQFRTLATDGDAALGGRDFDEQLVRYLAEQFEQTHGVDPRSEPQASRRLWRTAQETKHALSRQDKAVAVCRFAGMRLGVEVTRDLFETLIAHFLQRTLTTCREVLQQANLAWSDLSEILLVGGSSRIPAVAQGLRAASHMDPRLVDSPDEVVAHGAAIYAAAQTSDFLSGLQIVNVNAHSLGISGIDVATQLPINKIVIPRNTPLPASAERKFVTRHRGQESVVVQLLEGESENPRYCAKVAQCIVELEPNLPERTEVVVTLRYGSDGTIGVSAQAPRTRQSAHVEVSRHNVAELDPLEVWRGRLLQGEEPAPSTDEQPIAEPAVLPRPGEAPLHAVVQRADYLWMKLGEQFVASAAPATAVACQRSLNEVDQELELVRRLFKALEDKASRLSHPRARQKLQEDMAALRSYLRHAKQYRQHLQVALGRECSRQLDDADQWEAVVGELQTLRAVFPTAD